jgi:hypothetical protein
MPALRGNKYKRERAQPGTSKLALLQRPALQVKMTILRDHAAFTTVYSGYSHEYVTSPQITNGILHREFSVKKKKTRKGHIDCLCSISKYKNGCGIFLSFKNKICAVPTKTTGPRMGDLAENKTRERCVKLLNL